MGLFDQKQITSGSTNSSATQTATPWDKTVKPWSALLGGLNAELKNPAANPWLDSALSGTMDVANGGQMGIDPNLQAAMDDNAARAYTQVGRMGSAMGGFGGGANQAHLAREITSVNNPLLFANFQNQQARMDNARGMLGGLAQYMDQRPWDRFKNAGGILGIAGQMGGTKTATTTGGQWGVANSPSSWLQDAAGVGGLLGSFFKK